VRPAAAGECTLGDLDDLRTFQREGIVDEAVLGMVMVMGFM
jgi:hypothetical protein